MMIYQLFMNLVFSKTLIIMELFLLPLPYFAVEFLCNLLHLEKRDYPTTFVEVRSTVLLNT